MRLNACCGRRKRPDTPAGTRLALLRHIQGEKNARKPKRALQTQGFWAMLHPILPSNKQAKQRLQEWFVFNNAIYIPLST